MVQKTTMLHIRITETEKEAIKKMADALGEKPSRLLRKWVREGINSEPDLLTDETSLLKIAIRQLIGIANNLNQVVAAIHSRKTHRSVDDEYLEEIKTCVNSVKESLKDQIMKTKNRWVRKL